MSAAMINVGLMRERRFPVTAQCLRLCYGCCNRQVVATGPRLAGFAARRRLAFLFVVRRLPRTALCGDGEATILK